MSSIITLNATLNVY